MIRIQCHIKSDDYIGEIWPKEISCRPSIGDKIQSKNDKVLTISDIMHSYGYLFDNEDGEEKPYLKITLS
jgi:hypothetical protein